jgi:Myb-like DNA-binding protein REB1
MVSKEYRDGVKALLDLKKKDDDKDKGVDVVKASAGGDMDEKKDDNNVEAAVLRYVAGTLDSSRKGKRKKSFSNDEMNEFQHWNAFLNTDQLQQGEEINNTSAHADLSSGKSKKKRKADGTVNVDPELTQLDDTTDHEQLVRAAIRDANQLAQDVNIQDFIHQPHDEADQSIDNNIIQAAAVAVQQQEAERKRSHARTPTKVQPRTSDTNETSELVAVAVSKASSWVQNQSQSQGKVFSEGEIQAIDKFIEDYCKINSLTRSQICERVWANERKKDDFWDLLHKVLPYRTRASVYKHVRRTYHIFEVRGKWTPEEDERLARLAAEKDGQWKLIGEELGRMPEDCRDRWRNYVKCGKNRALNKWSTEEEEKLKAVISEMMEDQVQRPIEPNQQPVINWTTVSEQMGGVRSRIQCRYKWNKILKREALSRAMSIGTNDRIWLLNKLQELKFEPNSIVDWDSLASLHPKSNWAGSDLQLCYEKMRSNIRDFKKKTVLEICHVLLQDFVLTQPKSTDSIVQTEIPVVMEHFNENSINDKKKSKAGDSAPKSSSTNAIASKDNDNNRNAKNGNESSQEGFVWR